MKNEKVVRQLLVDIDVEAKSFAEYSFARLPDSSKMTNVLDLLDMDEEDPEKIKRFDRAQNRLRHVMPEADPYLVGTMFGALTVAHLLQLLEAKQLADISQVAPPPIDLSLTFFTVIASNIPEESLAPCKAATLQLQEAIKPFFANVQMIHQSDNSFVVTTVTKASDGPREA